MELNEFKKIINDFYEPKEFANPPFKGKVLNVRRALYAYGAMNKKGEVKPKEYLEFFDLLEKVSWRDGQRKRAEEETQRQYEELRSLHVTTTE